MNKINIETYENEKKANYKIYIDEKLELDVKGLRYNNTSDLMDEISRKYERYISTTSHPGKTVMKGVAKFAGYYEIAQAIKMMPVGTFTTKNIARAIIDEASSKFPQTHANISAVMSAFKKSEYPDWLEVLGMQGRSRLYKKTRDVSTEEIEDDLRKAAKKAWQ